MQKSIKQQYIDLREGNMSQANFMRNLRMSLPQYVTNVTSFEDSVRILKNKGILTEADEKGKWTNTSGKGMYDQFSEINNLNGQEVLIGIDAEMERDHELTKEEATKIVIKNLKKNPIYYTAEYMSGVKGYEPEYIGGKSANPEAHQMQYLEKNMGNVVDKKRGMQPVKDVEKAKKDSDKATAQKYKTSGIDLMSLVAKTVRGVKKMDATGEKMKKIVMKEEYDPGVEGEESPAYKAFVTQKQDEEEASKVYNGLKRGDNVKVNSEAADMLKLDPNATYTIKSFRVYRPGSLLQSVDVNLEDMNGRNVGDVNIEYVYETAVDENKAKVPGEIFKRNALAIKNTTKIGKGEEIEQRKLTKADLMKMIREELAEMFDGMEPMVRTGLDEDRRKFKDGPLNPTSDKRSRENDMLDDLLNQDIDTIADKAENNPELSTKLIARAKKVKPNLYSALKTALGYN